MTAKGGREKSIFIDLENGQVIVESEDSSRVSHLIESAEAFKVVSRAWLRCGWDVKYVYSFTWLGRPIIQLPDDMMRLQEVIYSLKPDVIIETGIAHGGSLIFYATLCKVIGRGRVIGIDIDIRPHNRRAIESHELFPFITLIEGSSVSPIVLDQVKAQIYLGETVLVLLDSCHTKEHVLSELNYYGQLVTKGSYIVAMDGIMQYLVGAPRTNPDWEWNNPRQAALDFVRANNNFIIEEPAFLFNESATSERVTYWPGAFIRRIK
jgi:cephalosporin hydroxylase